MAFATPAPRVRRSLMSLTLLAVLAAPAATNNAAGAVTRGAREARTACSELADVAGGEGLSLPNSTSARLAKAFRKLRLDGARPLTKALTRVDDMSDLERAVDRGITWCRKVGAITGSITRSTTTTTTTLAMFSQSQVNQVIRSVFDGQRQTLFDAAQNDRTVEAIRDFAYDDQANVVTLDMLSSFAGPENFRSLFDSQAWDITSALSGWFWSPEVIDSLAARGVTVAMLPRFRFLLEDLLEYECSPEVMATFAAKRAGEQDFLASCVVR
jgi:hypothetical protein